MSTPPLSVSRKSLSLSSLDEEAKETSKYQKKTEEVFLGLKTREMTLSEGTFDTEKGGDITDISLGLRAVGLHSDESEAALPIPVESSDEKYLTEMTAIQQLPEASKLPLEVTDDPDLLLGAVGGVGFGEVHESVAVVGGSEPEATEVDLEKLIESQESKELEAEEHEFKFLVSKVKSAIKDNFVRMFGDNPSFIPWVKESSQSSVPCDLESKREAFIDVCASNLTKLLNIWCQLAEPLKGGFGNNVDKLNQLLCEQKKLIAQEKEKLVELELEKEKLIEQEKEKSKAKSFLGKVKGKFGVKEETIDEKIGRKRQEINEKIGRKRQEINEVNRQFETSGLIPLHFSLSPLWVNFLLDNYEVRECNVAIKMFRVDWEDELRLHIVAGAHLNIAMPFSNLVGEDKLSVDVNIPSIDLSFYGINAGRVISNIELGSTLKTLPDILWSVIKKKVRIRPKKTKQEDRQYKTHVTVPKVTLSLGLDKSCQKMNLVIDDFDLETCISKKQEAYEVKLSNVLFELPSHTVNFVNDLCDQLGSKLTNSKIFIDDNLSEGRYMFRRPAALMNIIPATLRNISYLSQYCSMDTFSLSSSGTYFCVNRTIKSKSESKSKGYDVKVNHPKLKLYATHKTEEGGVIETDIHELSYTIKRLDEIDVVDFTFNPSSGGEKQIWPVVRKTLKKASCEKIEFVFNGFLFTNGLLLATDVWAGIFNNTTDLYDLMCRFKPEEQDAVIGQAFSTINFMRLVRKSLAYSESDEPRHMYMSLGPFVYDSVIGFFEEKRESKKDPRHRFQWAEVNLGNLHLQRSDSSLLQSLSCEAIIGEWVTKRETMTHWFTHLQPYFGDVKDCQIVLQGDERVFIYHLQMNDQGIEKCVFNTPEGVEKIVDESDEDAAENFVLSTLRAARPDIFSGLSAWVETTYM